MALKILIYLVAILVCARSDKVIHRKHDNIDHHGNASDIVPDKYIAGGHPAEIGQFPWIARLSTRFHKCAGSLISARFVLTAAHCLKHDIINYQDIKIYLGDYDRSTFPVDCVKDKCIINWMVNPDKIIKHFDYKESSLENDIALLRLEKAAPLSDHISPISLPRFDIDKPKNKGMPVAVTGWGTTERQVTSNILRTTEISMIPKSECPSNMPPKHLCAGDSNGKATCAGDSGGPLFIYHNKKYYLAGIVSYGPGAKCGTPKRGYYTNVYKYKMWIKRFTNNRLYL